MPALDAPKLVVLDRDGVINFDSASYIKTPEEWIPIPGSLGAIARLHRTGYSVFVVTNQSGIARRLFSRDALDAIHAKMIRAIEAAGGAVAGIYVCPHGPDDDCDCRKPRPGLLRQIESAVGVELRDHLLIGDKCSDVDAALAVGARPVLVQTGHGRLSLADCGDRAAAIYADLNSVASAIVEGALS